MMPPPTVGGLQPAARAAPLRFHPTLSAASQSFHQRLHGRDVTSVDGIAHQHGRGRIVDILAILAMAKGSQGDHGYHGCCERTCDETVKTDEV